MNNSTYKRLIEPIKSLVLVVLFLFTILLLYFFWGETPFQSLFNNDATEQHDAVPCEELLRPSRIAICFGDNSYVLAEQEGFDAAIQGFQAFSKGRELSTEEITKAQYDEIMMRSSMKAVFDYYVPFQVMNDEIFHGDKIPGEDAIDALSEIGFSEERKDSVFICDLASNKYFRLVGGSEDWFSPILEAIRQGESKRDTTYFTLGYHLGGEIENPVLFPVSKESKAYDFNYNQEFYPQESLKIEEMAKLFFSDNFDFVRKIEEKSGNVIYMYGYGEIVFIANRNGTFEYKRDEEEKAASQSRYLDSLNIARNFIAAHGSFENLEGQTFTPYIKRVIADPENRKGFRFVFGLMMKGTPLVYQSGDSILLDVIGGKVTYFKRDLIYFEQEDVYGGEEEPREAFPAVNLLAQNYEYICEVLEKEQPSAEKAKTEPLSFEAMAAKVESLSEGYVRLKDEGEGGRIEAAWVVEIGGLQFYFDLDDAEVLGYSRVE